MNVHCTWTHTNNTHSTYSTHTHTHLITLLKTLWVKNDIVHCTSNSRYKEDNNKRIQGTTVSSLQVIEHIIIEADSCKCSTEGKVAQYC